MAELQSVADEAKNIGERDAYLEINSEETL
jgi:hypothetical protein